MLKEYDFINEQGEKVVTKTIQYERKKDYSLQIKRYLYYMIYQK